MKDIIAWLNTALAGKELSAGMTYYKVADSSISATDGQLTACAPWPHGGKFFVPGAALERVLKRMDGDPTITEVEGGVKIKCGRFSGTIETLPLENWGYPGVDKAEWKPIPAQLLPLLRKLRPLVSENEQPAWGQCVALDNGWAYATNNISIVGGPCEGLGGIKVLLPAAAIDFVLGRLTGYKLEEWTWDHHFVAFRWANGAWLRTQLVVGAFPEKAIAMVRDAHQGEATQVVTDDFRDAAGRMAELASDTVAVYADRLEATFERAKVEDGIECQVPEDEECSIWSAKGLALALAVADSWSPGMWPKPALFKGPLVSGYIVGRKA